MPAPSNPTPVLQGGPAKKYEYKTIDDIKLTGPIRVLIFGPAKIGKTELLLTWPRPTIADYDGEGVKVAKNPGFVSRHGRVDFRYREFRDEIDPKTGIFKAATAFMESIQWLNHVINDDWTQTIGFDSLSSLSVAAHNAGLVASGKRNRSKALEYAKVDGVLLKGQQDFGAEMGAIEQLLDQLMAVKGKNVVVIAHEREESTDTGMTLRRGPLITGSRLRAQLAKWFDEVWHLDARSNGDRVLTCQPRGVLKDVGSRLGMPAEIINPTYAKIIQALGGKSVIQTK